MLLTLVLSIQAAYAAPLILLAQSRQERRDRVAAQNDREVAERTQADTEFLAREIAGVRLALADMVTGHDLDERLTRLSNAVEALSERVEALAASAADLADRVPDDATNRAATRRRRSRHRRRTHGRGSCRYRAPTDVIERPLGSIRPLSRDRGDAVSSPLP